VPERTLGESVSTWKGWRQAWERQQQALENLEAPPTCLGAPRITVEQSGKNIFFGNAAGAPGIHSHYSSFNDF